MELESGINIKNPILPGFNPDPSILRVGDDFYLANSTFEWFPGVNLYHSKNLAEWKQLPSPLQRTSQLNMAGVQSSGGIWAPCLSYKNGTFFLVYTNVLNWRGELKKNWGSFKDTHNYVVTSKAIEGPWSEPVYLNSSGFDPSMFHDEDGRSWLVNMEWDYRDQESHFNGILLQEFDTYKMELIGPKTNISKGSPQGTTEGPHLYKRNGYYYLLVAEGGTSYFHAASIARSKTIDGAYEWHPKTPFLSSCIGTEEKNKFLSLIESNSDDVLKPNGIAKDKLPPYFNVLPQKAGHSSMVQLDGDEWILAHLMGRPMENSLACPLGRETGVQRIRWIDDWPWVITIEGERTTRAQAEIRFPQFMSEKSEQRKDWSFHCDFSSDSIPGDLKMLRTDLRNCITEDPSGASLRLQGQESLVSTHRQSILAHSIKSRKFRVETELSFDPGNFQEMAGLIFRYDERTQVYYRVSYNEILNCPALGIISFNLGKLELPMGRNEIKVNSSHLKLAIECDGLEIQGWYCEDKENWIKLGSLYPLHIFSDEYAWPMGFTGAFAGMGAHDLSGGKAAANFHSYSYQEQ